MSYVDNVVFGSDEKTVDGVSLRVTSIRCTARYGEAGVSSTERLHGYSPPVALVQTQYIHPIPIRSQPGSLLRVCVIVDLKESECMMLFDFLAIPRL